MFEIQYGGLHIQTLNHLLESNANKDSKISTMSDSILLISNSWDYLTLDVSMWNDCGKDCKN